MQPDRSSETGGRGGFFPVKQWDCRKLAIIGDFSGYTSKPLKDFIYESNNGKDVFFVGSEQEAVERLTQAG